jgi:hypothetical protein
MLCLIMPSAVTVSEVIPCVIMLIVEAPGKIYYLYPRAHGSHPGRPGVGVALSGQISTRPRSTDDPIIDDVDDLTKRSAAVEVFVRVLKIDSDWELLQQRSAENMNYLDMAVDVRK